MFHYANSKVFHSAAQFEFRLGRTWGIRKNTKRKEWAELFEQADDPESLRTTPAGREKPPNSFKRARRFLKETQSLLPAQPPRVSPGSASLALRNATTSDEIISPVQIDNESLGGIDLPFNLEDTLANLGARLRSPSRAIITNQSGLTSTQPSNVTADSFITGLIQPSLWSPSNPNFQLNLENTSPNVGATLSSSIPALLSDQVAAGSSSTLDLTDDAWLQDYILGLNLNHTSNGNVQLAPISPREILSNVQNHFSLGHWHQEGHSELQVNLQTRPGTVLPVHSKSSFSSHFIAFEELLRTKGVSFMGLGRAGSGGSSPLFGGFTSRFIAEIVLSKQQSLTRRASDLETALGRLETLIPGESTSLTTKDVAFETKFTRILIFSMLNGFAGLNHIPVENMLNFIGRLSIASRSFLAALKEWSTPATRTFVDILFRASIEAKDNNTLEQLLKHRLVDVNETVCFFESERYTPIERAASLQAYSLIATLFHHGAKVNKTWVKNDRGGAFRGLMKGLWQVRNNDTAGVSITATNDIIKTVDLLVGAGASITLNDVEGAGNLFTTYDIACRLTLAIPPSDHRDFFEDDECFGVGPLTAQYADTQASQIIRNMIHHCEIACCGRCLVKFAENVERAAIQAAELGHFEVVRLLIDHVSSPTKIFCAAIRSNRKDLIDLVLSRHPDLNPPAQYLQYLNSYGCTTPLAEAVTVGNKEMINHLVRSVPVILPQEQ